MSIDLHHWRMKAVLLLAVAALPLGSTGQAQGMMRAPNLHIDARAPQINPAVAPRINQNVAVDAVGRRPPAIHSLPRTGTQSTLPISRYSPNLYPSCQAAERDSGGECSDASAADGGGKGGASAKKKGGGSRKDAVQSATNLRTIPNELVAEIDGALTEAEADEVARRHGLTRVESQNFPLLGATIGQFRITDRRPLDVVSRELSGDGSVRSVQPNFRYVLQGALRESDPAQYALAQLRLPQAHTLAHGMNVTVAVIDSAIDVSHPELTNSIADSFDALGGNEGPHVHGTGIAGAIAAHGKLTGSAPEVRILAIRAFSAKSGGAESTSYVILKALNYAALHGAQIVNMSFAGPKDLVIERAVAATAAKEIVLVAAAGNAGPKSPPLYPAANPNVIAVSGTDAQDKLFSASNRGNYIAIAAPGADIFLPAPDGKYQITSGTSFSAAFVSGIAALLLERNPALKPNEVRAILVKTARDLGTPGRDDLFGAGEADAFAAVTAAGVTPGVPVATGKDKPPVAAKSADPDNSSVSRVLNDDAPPSMASDKSAANDANRPSAR